MHSNINVIRKLIMSNVVINSKSKGGYTPLYFAAQNCSKECCKILIENGASVLESNDDAVTPLLAALDVENNSESLESIEETSQYLIENKSEVNHADIFGNTPILLASQNGFFNIVDLLIKKGANVNFRSNNFLRPIHMALHNEHYKIAKLLMENGADPLVEDENGLTTLHIAASG